VRKRLAGSAGEGVRLGVRLGATGVADGVCTRTARFRRAPAGAYRGAGRSRCIGQREPVSEEHAKRLAPSNMLWLRRRNAYGDRGRERLTARACCRPKWLALIYLRAREGPYAFHPDAGHLVSHGLAKGTTCANEPRVDARCCRVLVEVRQRPAACSIQSSGSGRGLKRRFSQLAVFP